MLRRSIQSFLILCALAGVCARAEEDLTKLPSLKVWLKPNPADAKGILNAAGKLAISLNNTAWEAGGKFGNVLSFDGEKSFVMMTSSVKEAFTDDCITVGVWVCARAEGTVMTELGSPQLNPGNWHDAQIEVMSDGEVKIRVWQLNAVSLGKIKFGEWHHVTLRYNRKDSTLNGFLDGNKSAGNSVGNREWNGNNPIHYAFGGNDGTNMGSGEFFDGYLDDIRIYNAALSDAQIKALAQGAPPTMTIKVRPPKPLPSTPGHHVMKFDYKAGDKSIHLPWLLYLPKDYDTTKDNRPLLVFMHGAGEGGTDCNALYIHGPHAALRNDPKFKDTFPFICIAPQCIPGYRWDSPDMDKAVVALIDYVESTFRVDKDRAYITGLSMGGKGTWLVAHAAPDRFAAIAPISAVDVYPDKAAERFKNMSLWIICGAEDGGFTEGSKKMAAVLKDLPREVKLTVFPHEGHGVWMRYYPGQELYQWLLSHRRGEPELAKSALVAAPPTPTPAPAAPAAPAPTPVAPTIKTPVAVTPALAPTPVPAPAPAPAPAPQTKPATATTTTSTPTPSAPAPVVTEAKASPAQSETPASAPPYAPITLSLAGLLLGAAMYLFMTPSKQAAAVAEREAEVPTVDELPTIEEEVIVEPSVTRTPAVPSRSVVPTFRAPAAETLSSTKNEDSTLVMRTPKFQQVIAAQNAAPRNAPAKFPAAAPKTGPIAARPTAPIAAKPPAARPLAAKPVAAKPIAAKPVAAKPMLAQKIQKPPARRWKTRAWLLGAALTGLTWGSVQAANDVAPLPQVQGQHKLSFDFKDGDAAIKVPYLLYLPKGYDKSTERAPMVVFLHGVGEMGSDLNGIFIHGPSAELERNPARKDNFPFIVLSPQATSKRWEDPHMVKAVVALIDYVSGQWRVDKDRTYLTGLSMGGRGTWEVAFAAPDRFAAIAPISAVAVQPEKALEKFKDLSIWIICGGADGGFTEGSKKMAEVLKESKNEVKFTMHDGEGHGVWGHHYPDPKFYEWFLTHRKAPPPAPPPTAASTKIEKPPSPPVMDESPAHLSALSARLIARAAKCNQKTQMKLFGKSENVLVTGVETNGLKVEWSGNSMTVRWKDVDNIDAARLAESLCPDDTEALFHAGALAGTAKSDALYNKILEKLRKLNASKAEELIGIVSGKK